MLLVGAGIVATLGIAWILGVGSSPRAVTADVSPTLTASMSGPTGPLTPRPTLATSATTPPVEPTRTARPTIVPTPTPSPTPTRSPSPAPSTEPTAEPELGFAIDFPSDGESLTTRQINIIGTAPRGSTITHDVPMWFDEHTVTRSDGIWMMPISLSDGQNRLTFRIGDDRSTEIVVTVVYSSPR